jgi:hypothetical protein
VVDQDGEETRIWQSLALEDSFFKAEFIDDLQILDEDTPESSQIHNDFL